LIELINSKSTKAIVVLALGSEHVVKWKKHSFPSLQLYCSRNKINLYLQSESLDNSSTAKKATWQKFLIPKNLKRNFPNVKELCYLDTDIICNPFSESIFDYHKTGTIGLVSQFTNLPYPSEIALRRIAFFRNRYYDSRYPLDSALFMTAKQIFKYHNFKEFEDYACAGLYMGEVDMCKDFLEEAYYKYDKEFQTITEGDEPVFNYEIQNHFKVNWLPYKFQTLWNYEMAIKHPHLYLNDPTDIEGINFSVTSSLMDSVFLHFAGSWGEKSIWESNSIYSRVEQMALLDSYSKYLNVSVTGMPKGLIRPVR